MNTFEQLICIITGTITRIIPEGLSQFVDSVLDFAYVQVMGLPFVVLGYRQTGKTTLLEWLKNDMDMMEDFEPDPTAAGGDAVPRMNTDVAGENVKVRARRDVGGEYAMWETDWLDLYREAKPRGIIFMLDHSNVYQHKDALNFMFQMIDDERDASKALQMVVLLVNKADLWEDDMNLDDVLDDYRNEIRRLKSQSERLGYAYRIYASSLVEPDKYRLSVVMAEFFNAIRPRPKSI
ncbi:MAG: hypothetical protein GYB68_00630 [Chloroflexi bacterium]|nr:hypothetical protein [Chloroflexota bacterium]